MSYVHGFKVPKTSEIRKAFGELDDNLSKCMVTDSFLKTFESLPLPKKSTDWLAQYAEKGQTYAEFLQLSRTLNTPASFDRNTIYLTVLEKIDTSLLDFDSLIEYTQRFFQMPVKIINPFINVQWNDERKQWNSSMILNNGKTRNFNLLTRFDETSNHSQICVTSILNLLKKVVPLDARCLIALTMYDLYGNDTDLFIAGLAMGNCRVAAFSLYRYDPYLSFNDVDWFSCKFNDEKSSEIQPQVRQNLLLLRSCRLLTHEICHLFGIDHCIFYSCLMNGSGDLEEDFRQPFFECPIDLRKLQILLKFDINRRYKDLMEFFQKHNSIDQVQQIEEKLDALQRTATLNYITTSTISLKRNDEEDCAQKAVSKRQKRLGSTMLFNFRK